jgi:hypothetical protein
MNNPFHWQIVHEVRNPYVEELKKVTKDTILFNGYFYLEDGAMPVYRICGIKHRLVLVKILEKRTLEDTSQYSPVRDGNDDTDPEDRICFFPTAIIELKIKILKELRFGDEEYESIVKQIIDLEPEVEKRSRALREEREEREMRELRKQMEK